MKNYTLEDIIKENVDGIEKIAKKIENGISSGRVCDDTVENGRVTGEPRYDFIVSPELYIDLI